MKITRYPQSCVVIEKEGRAIAIDPGKFFAETYTIDDLKGVEAVFYTHEHVDHFDTGIAESLHAKGVALYANASTAARMGPACTVVYNGDRLKIGPFTVVAYELPHCAMPDGSDGPQNTGYVIDEVFFDPGDGKELAGLHVPVMALPVSGPDVSMFDAFSFAKQVGAKVAIPVHYHWFGAHPDIYKLFARQYKMPFEVRVLADGESTEISA